MITVLAVYAKLLTQSAGAIQSAGTWLPPSSAPGMYRATEVTLLVREGPSSLTLYPVCKLTENGRGHDDDVMIMMLMCVTQEVTSLCNSSHHHPPTHRLQPSIWHIVVEKNIAVNYIS